MKFSGGACHGKVREPLDLEEGFLRFIESGPNIQRLAHTFPFFLYFSKIADIQAHSAAPSAALQACRSAILVEIMKMCASL